MASTEKSPRKRRTKRITLISIGTALLLIIVAVAGYAWSLSRTFDTQTEKIAAVFPPESSRPSVQPTPADPVDPVPTPKATAQNILLMGSDTRGSNNGSLADLSGQRSDTIMVIHIPADRGHIYMMSILRDSWLDIPGHGSAKINAALSWGGVPLAVQTTENLLGIRFDHVGIIDFAGFKGVIDTLGGVDINNPIPFESYQEPGRFFPDGPQHLNGTEALAFARERYAFADGDFQRVRNQQTIVRAILVAAMHKSVAVDPVKVIGLLDSVTPYLAVDEGFDSAYLVGLAWDLKALRERDVTFFTMPTSGTGASADGQSIVNIDWEKLETVRNAFQADSLQTYIPEFQTIQ